MLSGASLSALPISAIKTQIGTAPSSRVIIVPLENRTFVPEYIKAAQVCSPETTLEIESSDNVIIPSETRTFEVDE